MFRAMAVDCSVLLLSYSISSDALESPDLLLSYYILYNYISIAQNHHINNNPSIKFQRYTKSTDTGM